jgi:intein-encoded DNA endonuclease-like protein
MKTGLDQWIFPKQLLNEDKVISSEIQVNKQNTDVLFQTSMQYLVNSICGFNFLSETINCKKEIGQSSKQRRHANEKNLTEKLFTEQNFPSIFQMFNVQLFKRIPHAGEMDVFLTLRNYYYFKIGFEIKFAYNQNDILALGDELIGQLWRKQPYVNYEFGLYFNITPKDYDFNQNSIPKNCLIFYISDNGDCNLIDPYKIGLQSENQIIQIPELKKETCGTSIKEQMHKRAFELNIEGNGYSTIAKIIAEEFSTKVYDSKVISYWIKKYELKIHEKAFKLRNEGKGYGTIAQIIFEEFEVKYTRSTIKYWITMNENKIVVTELTELTSKNNNINQPTQTIKQNKKEQMHIFGKELREKGYSWQNITDMINEEFEKTYRKQSIYEWFNPKQKKRVN